HFERSDRVMSKSCRENDDGPAFLGQGIEHAKAVESGHFDVEKDNIGFQGLDGLHGGRTIAGLAGNFYLFAVRRQQALQSAARLTFVIDDQRTFHEGTPVSCGKTSSTFVPAGRISSNRKLADSP